MRTTHYDWWKFLLITVASALGSKGQQQYFRVKPQDSEVVEGHSVELQCRVANQAGAVQWSKDGFVLGFDRMIPGFPRYFMEGSGEDGVHDLKIENAQLEDDGEFQCQVGPTSDNKAIRADVKLTVLLPPSSIAIAHHPNGSVIEVHEMETVTLKCIVTGGKPAALIRWFRKSVELRPDNVEYQTEEVDEHRQNAISSITLTPGPEDNGAEYSCRASHKALTTSTIMSSTIKLSVLFPPGPPEIERYQEGETVRMGDTFTLACVSRGGNPLAELIWYRNDQIVDVNYTTTRKESTNTLTFVADSKDNNAIYKCEAKNSVSPQPMFAMVKLTVQFAPSKVSIVGPKEAQDGENVTLFCSTDRSNPPADVSWVVDGRALQASNTIVADPRGGWVTYSNVTVTISGGHDMLIATTECAQRPEIMRYLVPRQPGIVTPLGSGRIHCLERNVKTFSCYSVNKAMGETQVETAVISILYPPDQPTIHGYLEGTPIETGTQQKLTCTSHGGNPLPTLTWYLRNKELISTMTVNGNVVTSEVALTVTDDDNGMELRCEASNSASTQPVYSSVRLTVYFPPKAVKMSINPMRPRAGQKMTLTCESGSSNPQAEISWWKEGFLVLGTLDAVIDAPNGGRVTKNSLHLNVTSVDDGSVYTCQATNTELKTSAHDAVTINVLYKPEFEQLPMQQYDVIEGDTATINVTAKGNPPVQRYTWTKARSSATQMPADSNDVALSQVLGSGPVLNMTGVRRDQAGQYVCEAENEEGSSTVTVVLNVLYAASITMATELAVVDQGSNAFLECQVDANPVSNDVIRWQRANFDMGRTRQSVENGRSYLIIHNVTREDSGIFLCVADNGIGNEATRASILLVKHKPVIDKSAVISKAAANDGDTTRIICQATGAPNVSFTWFRDGSTVNDGMYPTKYEIQERKMDFMTWESKLVVKDVKADDYGDYECIAKNELGFESYKIPLVKKAPPDTPISLSVLNTTHDSVLLSWIPGFNGGSEQMFKIRFGKKGSGDSHIVDVGIQNNMSYTLSGLELGTEYVFQIMAYNNMGASSYLQEIATAATSSEAPLGGSEKVVDDEMVGKGDIPRIIIITVSVVGTCLLILNIVLVICFVRKRRKKRLEEESDHSSSKAATIEMYAPSSYNEGLNGESLSCNSEKSDNYSDGHSAGGYSEEQVKSETTAYITAHADGPYISDSSMPFYCPYPYPDQVNMDDRYERSAQVPNKILYGTEEEFYTNALRRNAYNLKLGDRPAEGYDKVGYHPPPPPPGRTAASGAEVHFSHGPEDVHYVPYPSSGSTSKPSPALSTFNPHLQGSPLHSTANQCNHMSPSPPDGIAVHHEMDGHLV